MNYLRYPEYKPSGVEWLGEVPGHWEVKRLKWTIVGCFNGIWGDEADAGDDDILCVRVADFDREGFRVELTEPTIRSVTSRERRNRLLQQGDLLLEKSGGGELQPVGAVVQYQLDNPAVCSNFVARLAVHEDHDSRFLAYFHSHLYQGRVNFRSIKQTTGIQNLDSDAYLSELIGLPPAKEQRAIAAFLDGETARIDALIEKKRRFIELLQEKRAALISRAVTRGLDPSVPLKDSGVEWLGQIPAHWEVKKGRFMGTLLGSVSPPEVDVLEDDDGTAYAKVDDLNFVGSSLLLVETKARVRGISAPRRKIILFPKRGAAIFTNKVAIVDGVFLFDSNLMGWQIEPTHDTKFVAYSLLVRRLDDLADVSTVPQINNKHIYPEKFPSPPLREQEIIVDHLDRETAKTDHMIAKVESAIEKLKEYRAALIAAAVTGKIDVREG